MTGLSLLQLDTNFPRVPGDVGCAETFLTPLQVLTVPGASVEQVVTDRPDRINLAAFNAALEAATGTIISTSCGFLAPFQKQLQSATNRPFVASALGALPNLLQRFQPNEIAVLTFDAQKLAAVHLGVAAPVTIIGLLPDMHLRRVIEERDTTLSLPRAEAEVIGHLSQHLPQTTQVVLNECTNLGPYKPAIKQSFAVEVVDILTEIEARQTGTVHPAFL